MSQSYFTWILRHRWLVVVCSALLIGLVASGARFLAFSNDYRMFFSEENPQLLAFEALQNTYTKTDNVLFVVSPKDGNVFTPNILATVEWLTRESWQIPYSLRVDSITNYQHTEAEEDDLRVADLVEDALSLDAKGLKKIRQVALSEPLLLNRLISPDGAHTGVNVTVQLPGEKLDEVPEVATFVEQLAQRVMQQNPGVEVRVTGLVMMNATFPKMAQQDMQTLYPLMLLIILAAMVFMLRSFSGVLVSMLVLIMSVLATLGLTGWLGIRMSPPTTTAPVMVMTLAVADCIHIIVLFLQGMRKGEDKETAMLESLRLNLGPVFLTSITTAIGFLSLNFSDAPPFRDLGNMAAMGVMVAFFLSLSFLPALLMILPVKPGTLHTRGQGAMEWLGDFVIRHRKRLFWGMAALIVLLVSQVPRNHLNDEFIKYFSENVPFRVDTDYAVEHLTGIYLLEYSLPAAGEGMIASPEYLQHVEAFANWLRQQPEVLHVNTITDIMKRLNKNMHGDDPDYYRLPGER
ncbi:MAG TPA: RND transporter, partial [Chromatiaceae bacterium]|nr:RND transporter [Chromatiaceae bacterium]